MSKKKILFVCIHNSARSQMAEAFINTFSNEKFEAESAGIEPGKLNPVVVAAMKDAGIDISGNGTKSVSDMMESGKVFDYVITVCDETSAERCPVFPGGGERLHWGFEDPSSIHGTDEDKLEKTKLIRDEIKDRIEKWIQDKDL